MFSLTITAPATPLDDPIAFVIKTYLTISFFCINCACFAFQFFLVPVLTIICFFTSTCARWETFRFTVENCIFPLTISPFFAHCCPSRPSWSQLILKGNLEEMVHTDCITLRKSWNRKVNFPSLAWIYTSSSLYNPRT